MGIAATALVSLFSGIMASMGLGGGMILIIYLTVFTDIPQLQAQGINLVFFIPIAVISLIFHTKNRLVHWKTALLAIAAGSVCAAAAAWFASGFSQTFLRKLFAGFLVLMGIKEFFAKNQSSGQ